MMLEDLVFLNYITQKELIKLKLAVKNCDLISLLY